MKKLKLALENLAVESFDTSATERPKGTVFGEQYSCNTCEGTCPATCPYTCDDATCGACGGSGGGPTCIYCSNLDECDAN